MLVWGYQDPHMVPLDGGEPAHLLRSSLCTTILVKKRYTGRRGGFGWPEHPPVTRSTRDRAAGPREFEHHEAVMASCGGVTAAPLIR